jgi:hypothetical protein
MPPRWRGELEEEASMSMSHSSSAARFTAARAWFFFDLSQLVLVRSDRATFSGLTQAFEPELARVMEDGSGCRLRGAGLSQVS